MEAPALNSLFLSCQEKQHIYIFSIPGLFSYMDGIRLLLFQWETQNNKRTDVINNMSGIEARTACVIQRYTKKFVIKKWILWGETKYDDFVPVHEIFKKKWCKGQFCSADVICRVHEIVL